MATKDSDGSEGISQSTRPSSLPPYTDLFSKEHSRNLDASIVGSRDAVVLKVSKLDDGGRLSEIQWKYDQDPESIVQSGHSHHGYGIFVTALFIIGEMVGGGIISMPNALYRQGWGGIAVICIVSVIAGFTAVQLGKCWTILQERWPEIYLKHTQKPYPEMGYRVGGVWTRRFVSLCVNLSLIGTATVFLIIVGRNVTQLLRNWAHTDISFCLFVLIVAAILLPVTYLGSPKDFWQVSFGAAGSTTVAVIIMIIGMSMQYKENKGQVSYPAPSFIDFVLGYGTVMFAYSGHCAFPTIQHDMKRPDHFPKAIVQSFSIIFFYYLPVTVLGYVVYGDKLGAKGIENVLQLLPPGWCQDTVTVLITLHVMFGYIIFINPVNQELESLFRVPSRFTWKRLVVRTCTMAFILFLAESIPAMSLLLDLVGGTALAFLAFVFPGVFNLKLRWHTRTKISDADKPIEKWEYPVTGLIILIGFLGAIGSVYAFIATVVDGDALFKKPCYVNGGE